MHLQVPKGQIFGLLGPNGAGKSTLLKILLTIIKPTRCKGVLLGHPIGHKPTLKKVGYLPEHARFPSYLTGRQVIGYTAGLCDVSRKFAKRREEELLDFVGMSAWADRKMETYSKGMKQRIGLAQSLVNDPDIVFLDEPTDGVDPQGQREMRGVLKELKEQGRTVFVNSHMLGELEMVCDSVAILNQGEIIKHGDLQSLMNEDLRYTVRYQGTLPHDLLDAYAEDSSLTVHDGVIDAKVNEASEIQHVIDELRTRGVIIEELRLARQSLEDLFMAAVEGTGPGGHLAK